MGAKLEKETVDLLKANAIHLKCLVQEVQLLRRDMAKHSAEQQAALKEWMAKDLDHHYKDNKVALSAIEMIKEKAREKEKFAYPATISQEKIEEAGARVERHHLEDVMVEGYNGNPRAHYLIEE